MNKRLKKLWYKMCVRYHSHEIDEARIWMWEDHERYHLEKYDERMKLLRELEVDNGK